MIESLIAFIKTLPHWLASVVEVLIVTVIFMTCITFLAGVWCGLKIIGRRANSIKQIDFIPPKIIFETEDDEKNDKNN